MKTVLITGFEPFGGATINPALEAIKQLEGREVDGAIIRTVEVPVVHQKAVTRVLQAIDDIKPDVVLMIGQATGRTAITPERIAMNMDDFRIPDNEGNQFIDEPVVADGSDAYFTTAPIKAMTQAMRKAGIPATVSNTAGSFVCNHLFYGITHALNDTGIKSNFIHIPLIPEQCVDGTHPTMALETIVSGLAVCASVAATVDEDIKVGGGKIN